MQHIWIKNPATGSSATWQRNSLLVVEDPLPYAVGLRLNVAREIPRRVVEDLLDAFERALEDEARRVASGLTEVG